MAVQDEDLDDFIAKIRLPTFSEWKLDRELGAKTKLVLRLKHVDGNPDIDSLYAEVNYSPFNTPKSTFSSNIAHYYTNAIRREVVNFYAIILSTRKRVFQLLTDEVTSYSVWYSNFIIFVKAVFEGLKKHFKPPLDYFQLFGKMQALERHFKRFIAAEKDEETWKAYLTFMHFADEVGILVLDRCEKFEAELNRIILALRPAEATKREQAFMKDIMGHEHVDFLFPQLKQWCTPHEAELWEFYCVTEAASRMNKYKVKELCREIEAFYKEEYEKRFLGYMKHFWANIYQLQPNELSPARFYSVQCRKHMQDSYKAGQGGSSRTLKPKHYKSGSAPSASHGAHKLPPGAAPPKNTAPKSPRSGMGSGSSIPQAPPLGMSIAAVQGQAKPIGKAPAKPAAPVKGKPKGPKAK